MTSVPPAAVAGVFYVDHPDPLRHDVRGFLRQAALPDSGKRPAPKAVIAPHAGYPYSGPVAGFAYATVVALRERIKRIVLLGPSHRVYVEGIAASTADGFATPLGSVRIDQDTVGDLVGELGFVHYSDEAHALVHSLEVQLPFVQDIFEDLAILPFAVGEAAPIQVQALLERLWGGDETLIVISSDLSHYRGYEAAREIIDTQRGRWGGGPTAHIHFRAVGVYLRTDPAARRGAADRRARLRISADQRSARRRRPQGPALRSAGHAQLR